MRPLRAQVQDNQNKRQCQNFPIPQKKSKTEGKGLTNDRNGHADVKMAVKNKTTSERKPFIRRPWSDVEQECVERYFIMSITQPGIVPGKTEIEEFIKINQRLLNNRNWKDVKYCMWNMILKNR